MVTVGTGPESKAKRGKRRRGHGEGSIFRRADGRWAAEVDLGYAGGKRNRMTVYGRTRREVQEKLDALRLQHAQGVPLSGRRDTVEALLDRWYSTLKPRPQGRYSPTTLKGYADAIRLHLKPRLGHVRIAELNADHIQALQVEEGAARGGTAAGGFMRRATARAGASEIGPGQRTTTTRGPLERPWPAATDDRRLSM